MTAPTRKPVDTVVRYFPDGSTVDTAHPRRPH